MLEAVVIVLRRDERVLVIRRGPDVTRPGFWSAPSGRVEPGEAQADAVVREAREELGLTVLPLRQVWITTTDDQRYRLHWWLADITGGELVPHPGEVAEVRWVSPEEFLGLDPVFGAHREFFTRILPALDAATTRQ